MTQREAVATLLREVESHLPRIEWGPTTEKEYVKLGVDPKLMEALGVMSQVVEHGWFSDEEH